MVSNMVGIIRGGPRRRLWRDRLLRLLLSAPSLPLNSSTFQHEHAIRPDVGAVRNLVSVDGETI
jgi:hypothetical protein